MKELLKFLSDLKENNTREWFQENKERYQDVKLKHEDFVGKIISGVSSFDCNIPLLKPSECVFRIYRDVRFSKNKDPYKTAFGAVFSKGGRKSKFAGYYLHIEPGNSFVGGGIWRPESDALKSIRYEIYNFPEDFMKIIEDIEFADRFGKIDGEKLKNPPKDFPADFKHIELLKLKSFTVGQSFTDEQIMSEEFLIELMKTFQTMKPFIGFLNRGIEG